MSVYYKFKSSLDFDTVKFDGLHISVDELKKAILQNKKIGKSSDFDLQITHAQTKEVYTDNSVLIPKNTSLIVSRMPITGHFRKSWDRNDSQSSNQMDKGNLSPSQNDERLSRTADLVNANASEDDKIRAMMSQSSREYDPSKYIKSSSMTGPIPPNYLCHRCGKPGHWIKNCPTNSLDVKRSTGIPRSFMVTVDGPDHKGAYLTSSGHYAVPVIDHEAYKGVKKDLPPGVVNEVEVEKPEEIPEELLCLICKNLLNDAVLIPCCGNSYCDECVRQVLLDSENHECPTCHETDISPDNLIPTRALRASVKNHLNKTAMKSRGRANAQAVVVNAAKPVAIVDTVSPSVNLEAKVVEVTAVPEPSEDRVEPEEAELPSNSGTPTQEYIKPVTSPVGSPKPSLIATSQADNSTPVAEDDRPGTPLADEVQGETAPPSDAPATPPPTEIGGDKDSEPQPPGTDDAPVPSSTDNQGSAGESAIQAISTLTTRGPLSTSLHPPHHQQHHHTVGYMFSYVPRIN